MISGNYVARFAEASHALPQGMHLNADYPFMLPRIAKIEAGTVTIEEGGKSTTFEIVRRGDREVGFIEQSSSFERIFGRRAQRFEMQPFKDRSTPAVDARGAPDEQG
jgi:hypothetical protein